MPLTRSSTPVYSQGPAPCLTQSGQVSECQLQEAKSQRGWKRRSQCPCLLTTTLLSGSTAQQGRRYLGKVRRNEASGEQGEANMTLKLLSLSGWFQSLESVRSSDMCMTLNVSLRRAGHIRAYHSCPLWPSTPCSGVCMFPVATVGIISDGLVSSRHDLALCKRLDPCIATVPLLVGQMTLAPRDSVSTLGPL